MGELLHHNSGVVVPRDEYEELTEAMATVFRLGARFLPSLVERLDLIDGDADDEAEEDCGQDEGEPDMRSYVGEGPGCPISDSDVEHDGREREDGY